MSGIKPPKIFVINSEMDMSAEWSEWLELYENYFIAAKIAQETPEIQAANFKNVAGRDALKVLNNLNLTAVQKQDLKIIIAKLTDHFSPSRNKTYERCQFHRMKQQDNEAFEDFLQKLQTQVKRCGFPGTNSDEFVMDQIVLGVHSDMTRQKLWTEDNLSLSKAIKICRAAERAEKQMNELQNEASTSQVNAVNTDHKHFDCGRCGNNHGPKSCPAFNKTCGSCGRKGHFRAKCRKGKDKPVNPNEKKYRPEGKKKSRKVHSIRSRNVSESESESSEYSGEYGINTLKMNRETKYDSQSCDELKSFKIKSPWTERKQCKVNSLRHEDKKWTAKMLANGSIIKTKLDTGAECNVLSLKEAKRIGGKLIASPTKALIAYNDGKIDVIGEIRVTCKNKKYTEPVVFKVVKQDLQPILGRRMCEKMGFIKRVNKVEVPGTAAPKEIGCHRNYEYNIDFVDNPVFRILPARRVPYAIREQVKKELNRMVKMKVIEPVSEPSPAVSPMMIVNKGKLRICMDPTELNKNIKRRHYPLKTVEEIIAKVKGANFFTKLDCEKGFWQIKVNQRTSKYLAFSTPWGRYRYLRLPFGISAAPEIFSEIMNRTLEGIKNCEVAMDDIFIYGKTQRELEETTTSVVKRLQKVGLTLNQNKCEFNRQRIKFLGHVFTPSGCEPDKDKISAIQQLKTPANVKQLQRLLGMVNYVGKFVKNLSQLTEPLRRLLVKNVEWYWDTDQEKAFEDVKKTLSSLPALAYYDVNKPVKLSVDSSSVAMGCCLMQEDRPIAYATRALTPNQQLYPQLVKEAMAIRFGCVKFHEYIYGKELLIETDHKPLETIFKKPIGNAPVRLQKILWDVLQYSPVVKYIKGTLIPIADSLSRDCDQTESEVEEKYHVNAILSITNEAYRRYIEATQNDPELQSLKVVLFQGWPDNEKKLPEAVRKYATFKQELTYENGLLFKGTRVIVPKAEKSKMLNDLHTGHPGINSMLSRARQCSYWIGQSSDIKNYVESCATCQRTQKANTKEPALIKKVPDYPFQIVSSDIFKFRGADFVLIADHYSGFIDFRELKPSTSTELIAHLKQWFAVHGIPETFESDGGPQYASNIFKDFTRKWKFNHRLSSPQYPRSNGFAERNVQTIKNLLKKCSKDGTDIDLALLICRNTERNKTLKSPAQRLFSRSTRTTLLIDKKKLYPRVVDGVTEELRNLRTGQKHYYDTSAKPANPVQVGDKVRLKTGHREWIGAKVTGETPYPRSVIVVTEDGRKLRRNQHHLHRTKANIREPQVAWPDFEGLNVDERPESEGLNIDERPKLEGLQVDERPESEGLNIDERPKLEGFNIDENQTHQPQGRDETTDRGKIERRYPNLEATNEEQVKRTRSGRAVKPTRRFDPSSATKIRPK